MMKRIFLSPVLLLVTAFFGVYCSGGSTSSDNVKPESENTAPETEADSTVPPQSWQEHWFEHNQLVKRIHYNEDTAIYFDNDMNYSITWPNRYFGEVWEYVKQIYGPFGSDSRLFVIFHRGKYSGGHPSTYFDASHNYRNVIDLGPGPWADSTGNNLDLPTHEIAHIVEGAAQGVKGSPAFGIWRDSKWAEIFNYDVYKSLEMEREATRWYNMMISTSDNFPRENTHWFRDWFYPIWNNYGKSEVLGNYFELLAEHFPQEDGEYSSDLNWGEFIHFWSGSAGANLKEYATNAFGWSNEWDEQFKQAQADFSDIKY